MDSSSNVQTHSYTHSRVVEVPRWDGSFQYFTPFKSASRYFVIGDIRHYTYLAHVFIMEMFITQHRMGTNISSQRETFKPRFLVTPFN